jgi:hypothetical protein
LKRSLLVLKTGLPLKSKGTPEITRVKISEWLKGCGAEPAA